MATHSSGPRSVGSHPNFGDGKMFDRVFDEGMQLVDEAAQYLDGPGRRAGDGLSRRDGVTYAAWSMELTTRLMQVASWLVMQRSVRRGDMPPEQALADKYRLERDAAPLDVHHDDVKALPADFLDIVERCESLFERVVRMDNALYVERTSDAASVGPVNRQIETLRKAAEQGTFDPLQIWSEKINKH